jgi:hypothetical protein
VTDQCPFCARRSHPPPPNHPAWAEECDRHRELRRFRCELLATSIRWIDDRLNGGVSGPSRSQLLAQRRAAYNMLMPLLMGPPDGSTTAQ